MLKDLANARLIDYVAMDIKGLAVYSGIMGEGVSLDNIQESVEFLKTGKIDFEFRTTCVPGIHAKEDFTKISKWIG
jgi:pyruvate formate lyase activating enzyme